MARKGTSTEKIIGFLREAEARLAHGETAGKICRGEGISEQTYYKWRRDYGGLKIDQTMRHVEQYGHQSEIGTRRHFAQPHKAPIRRL